ncbi:MAG: acyl-CoA dehydrogenase family protein [Trebonia sp.]
MRYAFDADQDAFRGELRRWASRVLAPHYQPDDKAATFRRQQALDMASMGLTGLRIPAKLGGQDAPAVFAGIAAEEVGRADFNAGYLIINTALISDVIVRNATDAQQASWLPPIAEGSQIPCICITEPGHGTDAAGLTLAAVPDRHGWRLRGEKTSITLGMASDRAVVLARTGGTGARGVSAFWVNLTDERVTRAPFDDLGSRAIGRASIHFDDVPVTRDELIGAEGDGFVSVMQGFDYSRAVIGLLCLGAAQQSLDEAAQWARDREAFGRPIGTYQGIAFPLAEYATYLHAARHVCYEALWRKDEGLGHACEAAMAKFWAPKLSAEVIHQCLLTFGHLGYSAENPVGQRLRDVIGLEIGDGTAQAAKLVVARHLLGRTFAP